MQTITPALEAILKSKFQAAASGFRSRVEIDDPSPPAGASGIVQKKQGSVHHGGVGFIESFDGAPTEGNTLVGVLYSEDRETGNAIVTSGWAAVIERGQAGQYVGIWSKVAGAAEGTDVEVGTAANGSRTLHLLEVNSLVDVFGAESVASFPSSGVGTITGPELTPTDTPGTMIAAFYGQNQAYVPDPTFTAVSPLAEDFHGPVSARGYFLTGHLSTDAGAYTPEVDATELTGNFGTIAVAVILSGVTVPGLPDTNVQPPASRISIDKSLRMVADQAVVEFPNEDLALGWGPSSVFRTNQRMRIFQWYGDVANAVKTFTGVIDAIKDGRTLLTTTVTCRDMMAILIDQTFSASAPQGADEVGAVRTPANGVYLSMEVSAIVADMLDRAGWPAADRAITATSYVLDEFIVQDGASWADTIIGDEQLTGLVGYSAWADELGVFHFAPTAVSQNLTDPLPAAYTFRADEDIVSLDYETDQYDLRTRVKVRGPLTTTTLQDTWRELWRTTKITKPVGLWYDPTDSANLRVISRSTKRLYKLRQSDRVVLSSVYLGSVIPYPLGLSGDPADSTVYWVLNAPWIYTGSTSGNSVKKVRKSDNVVLATYGIPNGRWSALKVSSSYLWLTNLDTDRFYKRSKTDGSAIDDYQHTYNAVTQANPSGIMVDGTTLYLFWANGGTTARFLLCDESVPGTVTGVVKTVGTTLHGGEMDTTTQTECYGDADDLNLVAKFTLLEVVDQTDEVSSEVVDVDLEDELGAYAHSLSRVHDAHSGDAAHAYEVRRMTLDLRVITSLNQAIETAQRQLDILAQRRRAMDTGIVGNPALQKTDLVAVVDPVTSISTEFVIDTYRSQMDGDGTYLGTLALLPVADVTDTPTDDGDATE
jgi:hypothetical protein